MKSKLILLILGISLCASITSLGQRPILVGGGEAPNIPKGVCVTPEQRTIIEAQLQTNIAKLKAEGKLPENWGATEAEIKARPTNGDYIWPIRIKSTETRFNNIVAISNYVDLAPINPGTLEDWNCGERTYDFSGYNHSGIDIYTWPFSQYIQENNIAEIVAVTDGIIIDKIDGNYDKNCAMGGSTNWNAVYVGNTDGTITWYGHMKSGSLTTKRTGDPVAQGEFLGIVGSSGSSTGPHLHLETHSASARILEPFAGTCNPGQSLWQNQEPYYNTTINAVFTHSAPPVFPSCPQIETLHLKNNFQLGDPMYVAVYVRDFVGGQTIALNIYDPNNVKVGENSHSDLNNYSSCWWYWYHEVDSNWVSGRYKVVMNIGGKLLEHFFTVGETVGLQSITGVTPEVRIFPNPSKGNITLQFEQMEKPSPATVAIINAVGQNVYSKDIATHNNQQLALDVAPGIYHVIITSKDQEWSTRQSISITD